ncbi:MAG: AbrB/MazE/SpoVT family DNA-binding domain-containing protein [Clostridia bacterium]|nr:AbrB/MazE/SpoVT family DNA-binding domain-containing protein [Clostridia bacterium]
MEGIRKSEEERFIVSVKVGPKGQITIPVEARKMFDIKEGDTLMVMGDKTRGLAIMKDDIFYTLMGGISNNDGDKDN